MESLLLVKLHSSIGRYSELTGSELEGQKQEPAKVGKAAPVFYSTTIWRSLMKKIIVATKTFIADEQGVTAIEYGLIAALIGLAMAAGATTLGSDLSSMFTGIANKLVGLTPS
jgi:pilus assembly protein Flp/PilA